MGEAGFAKQHRLMRYIDYDVKRFYVWHQFRTLRLGVIILFRPKYYFLLNQIKNDGLNSITIAS